VNLAHRLDNLPPYVFAALNKRIADRRARGDQVINFGMGDPDLPMPDPLVDAFCAAAHDPQTHRYPNYFGMPALRRAMSAWYGRRFDVTLDPETEVLPLIGSKEGIAHAALAFCDPGDRALVPNPGYPVYRYSTLLAGGEVVEMPLLARNGFLPDLDALEDSLPERVRVMWLNYPNNPTGAVADLAFFERAVDFARRHDLVICHDNPYSEICYGGYRAPSILQVPGARDVAVEFNSLSKTYNMAGLRIGMVVGGAQIVEALGRIKSNIDSGVPTVVQETALAALTGDQTWIAERNKVYERRRDRLVPALRAAGIGAPMPRGSLYIWGEAPGGLKSSVFAERLLDEAAIVVTAGSNFGSCGEGYFRMSLTVSDVEVEEAVCRLQSLRF
jgi:LL-diaminopimelate aminotransferase